MSKKILVVDDEIDIAEIIKNILFEYEYEVSIATDGSKALEILMEKKFDLIISDIRMPHMDGVELLEDVRKKYGIVPPVIMLTGHSDFDEEELHKRGAVAFLNKPFQIEELMEVIEEVLVAHS